MPLTMTSCAVSNAATLNVVYPTLLKLVSSAVQQMRSPQFGCLVITHYKRILNYLKPDFVHVMHRGKIIKSGGPELAEHLEEKGYSQILKDAGIKVLETVE